MREEPSLMEEDLQIMIQLQMLIGQISSDVSAIALIDHNNRIKWKYMLGNLNERYRHTVMKPGIGITGQVVRFGRMIIVDELHPITDKVRAKYPIMISEQLLSVAAMPLKLDHHIFGTLLIGDRQCRTYSNDVIEAIEQTANTLIEMLPKPSIQFVK